MYVILVFTFITRDGDKIGGGLYLSSKCSIPGLGALAVRDEVMGREGYQCVAKRV